MCTQYRETKQPVLTKITFTADWSRYDKRDETKAVITKDTEKLLQEHFNQRSENLVVVKHKKASNSHSEYFVSWLWKITARDHNLPDSSYIRSVLVALTLRAK